MNNYFIVGVLMASSEGSSLSVSGQKPNSTLEPESYLGFLFEFCNFFRITKDFFIQLL